MADVTIQEVGPCKKQLKITVPQADIQAKVEENFATLAENVVIDGFRKGHVPRKLIERRFGEEVLEEVKQTILSEAAEAAVEEHNLKVLGTPSFDNVEFAADTDCVFELTVEVEPDFDLTEYKGIKLTRKSNAVTDEEIERGLENLRRQRATLELQEQDTPVAENDFVNADWEISSEGEMVANEKEDQFIVSGKRFGGVELEKDLAEVLKDAKFGEKREATGKILDAYEIEKWRGKDCTLTLTVKEIRRPLLPELNDEFAKKLDFETVDELKEYAKRNLEQSKTRENDLDLERQLFDQLLTAMPFDLPEGVLKAQAVSIMRRQQYRLQMRGMPAGQIEEHLEDLRDASEEAAARNLKIFFVLNKIAEKEKLFVTENDVENRIAQMANSHRMTVQKMRRQIEQDGSLSELRAGMREDKAIEFLMTNADVADAEGGEKA